VHWGGQNLKFTVVFKTAIFPEVFKNSKKNNKELRKNGHFYVK